MSLQPYLFFDGRCEEAINFYREAIGAEVDAVVRFKDGPPSPNTPPAAADKIMHASFRVSGSVVSASDGMCSGSASFHGFSLCLTVKGIAEADQAFAALSAGGQVQMPLSETFFSPRFGMLADKFGVSWMIYVEPASS